MKWYHWGLIVCSVLFIVLDRTRPWQHWPKARHATTSLASSPNPRSAPVTAPAAPAPALPIVPPVTAPSSGVVASMPPPVNATVVPATVAVAPAADAGAIASADVGSPETIGHAAETADAAPVVAEPVAPARPALNCQLGSVRFPGVCAAMSTPTGFARPTAEPIVGWNCGEDDPNPINFRANPPTIDNCRCRYCEVRQ